MHYIVPSIGRCGSSVMVHQLHKAARSKNWQYRQDWTCYNDAVIKTHAPFAREPEWSYRAVYCWGPVGDIVASMYQGMDGHLMRHLRHLGVTQAHLHVFEAMRRGDVCDAWMYLVRGDKLGFINNLTSWEKSTHTLFVHYSDWLRNPRNTFKQVSEFTGLNVGVRKLHQRRGRFGALPGALQDAIRTEYKDLAE